jgi:hypothetical protein
MRRQRTGYREQWTVDREQEDREQKDREQKDREQVTGNRS